MKNNQKIMELQTQMCYNQIDQSNCKVKKRWFLESDRCVISGGRLLCAWVIARQAPVYAEISSE